MEPPMHTIFPCSPREHNAQAPERAPVTVARNRVFPKGEVNMHCQDRRTPLRHWRNMIIAPLQRVNGTDEVFYLCHCFVALRGKFKPLARCLRLTALSTPPHTKQSHRLSADTIALQ